MGKVLRPTTIPVATGLREDGLYAPTYPVDAGRWLIGMSGNFDGATVTLFADIGHVTGVPLHEWEAPEAWLFTLGRCAISVLVEGAGPDTNVSVGAARCSIKLNPKKPIPRELWGKGAGAPL